MATTYTRRINLYINGKEVRNDIASIKGAMSKLINEQARMVLGSKEYYAHAAEINKLRGILRQHQADINNTKNSWFSLSKAASKFNQYFGMITAAMASFTGVALTVKSAIDAYNKFDDKLADVMKTTGMSKDEVVSLNEELKKIDTRTSQMELLDLARVAGKLGITGQENVMGFVRAADQIRVALSEDLGGNVEESINQIGKLVDIFKIQDVYGVEESMLKIGSAINSLGAAGTANEGYMVEFAKRVGGIAPMAGISIQQILGLGATLDELGQTSEVSGTVINSVVTAMFKDTATYAEIAGLSLKDFTELLNTDANEAFIRMLEGAKGSSSGFSEMAQNLDKLGLDGARSTGVLAVLGNNIEKLREKQAFSNQEFQKGISLTNEFNVKNQTAQAHLEKAKKAFFDLQVELGKRLTPAYTSVIGKSTALLKIVGSLIEFLYKYSGTIITVVSSIASYTIATKLAVLWTERANKATLAQIALSKLQALWTGTLKGATMLFAAAQASVAGNTARAAAAMRVFNTVTKLNPVGLLVTLLTTAATAFFVFRNRAFDAAEGQRKLNAEIERSAELQNQNKSLEQRASVMNNLSKTQLENLKTDIGTQIQTEEDFHAELLSKLKTKLSEDQKLKEISERLSAKEITKIQQINLEAQAEARRRAIAADLEDQNKANQARLSNLKSYQSKVDSELKKRPGTSPDLTPSDPKVKPGDKKKAYDASIKALDEAFQERLLKIEQQHIAEQTSDVQFKIEMAVAERAYLSQKLAFMEAAGESSVTIQRQLLETEISLITQNEETLRTMREENMVEFDAYMEQQLANENERIDRSVEQSVEAGKDALNDMEDLKDEEVRIAQERANIYLQLADQVGNSFQEMLMYQQMSFGDFLKETLLMALEALEKIMLMSIAETTIKGLATLNPFGIAKAVAKIVLIKAAFGVAKAAVMGKKGNSDSAGYSTGGYTPEGPVTRPAGTVHAGEWVAPKWMVDEPFAARVIAALENYRRNHSRLNPDLTAGRIPFATGGMVTQQAGNDPELKELLRLNTEAIERFMKWQPKVATELIKRDLDTLDNIQRNRGL